MALDRKRGLIALAAGLGGLVVIIVVIAAVVAMRRDASSGAGQGSGGQQGSPDAVSAAAAARRTVLENEPSDDAARAEAFKRVIKDSDGHCDRVDRAAMVSSGVWTVRCANGEVYRLTYTQKGKLQEVKKLM
jgi:uncharacterized membrane protein